MSGFLAALGLLGLLFLVLRRLRDAAADLPHIYTRFWRADASRSLPGNGLGLALVKAIVTSYGGRLHCDSVPGQGSAFTVVLPTDG